MYISFVYSGQHRLPAIAAEIFNDQFQTFTLRRKERHHAERLISVRHLHTLQHIVGKIQQASSLLRQGDVRLRTVFFGKFCGFNNEIVKYRIVVLLM